MFEDFDLVNILGILSPSEDGASAAVHRKRVHEACRNLLFLLFF